MLAPGQAATEYTALAVQRVVTLVGRQAARVQEFASEHTALVAIVLGVLVLLVLRPRRPRL